LEEQVCGVFRTFILFLGLCLVHPAVAYWLGMFGDAPDWSSLDPFQETMSFTELKDALSTIYLPDSYDEELICLSPCYVLIRQDGHSPDSY
tara:strand:+ start:3933 stop:4205 length:273 start_codon:yes stop_codon:yes gene_type:complete